MDFINIGEWYVNSKYFLFHKRIIRWFSPSSNDIFFVEMRDREGFFSYRIAKLQYALLVF